MRICAVIPAYNEAAVISGVVEKVKQYVDEVVVVDDGSKDATAILARQAGATVLQHFLNRGQCAALQTGIAYAVQNNIDAIVTIDADGQHEAAEIPLVIEPLLLGRAEVVLGSRFLKPDNAIPSSRQKLLRAATVFTRLYTGLHITDTHNGFRAFSKAAASKLELKQDSMAHASEVIEQIKKHNLKFTEVGVTVHYTQYSLHKGQKLTNSFKIVWDLLLGRIVK
jgi:polyprenyl-phospho-N-acetylgalactosaminyl synthase